MVMGIYQRIEIAKKTLGRTNCGGTALFIVGMMPRDEEVDIVPTLDYCSNPNPPPLRYFGELEQLAEPREGCLILFRHKVMNNFPQHTAVVISTKKGLQVVSRPQPGEGIPLIFQGLDECLQHARRMNEIVEYYLPAL
jgi:hypothetical protein